METTTKKKILVSSSEAMHICNKNQYGEASFIELIKLNIRLIYCKVTRAYVRRNTKLTKAMKKCDVQVINASVKEEMKARLEKELTK